MYQKISVAIDNSEGSGNAETLALQVARASGGSVTGVHAYTGRFHRSRFQALEGHLPEQYQKEDVMEHQRSVHSVLIERGLALISAEYMKRLGDSCRAWGISFSETIADGKNSDVLIDASKECDLMIMGAEGLGRISSVSGIGSNTRRMLRHGKSDLLIVRQSKEIRNILAAVDGSEDAYRMAEKAADLARAWDGSLTIATSFDPRLHKMVFGSLSSVLSKDAGQVFRFSDQEKIHNEVIDRSLADLYTGYLEKASAIARTQGIAAHLSLMEGKPFHSICSLAKTMNADLIVVGRAGMHRGKYSDIGSNAEKIVEQAGTNVLVVTNKTPDDSRGSVTKGLADRVQPLKNTIIWSEEATERLERVPSFARPMAVMAIERFALENGHSVITPEIMNQAREKLGI
jgi:nucleotide-binding universal stress UspA family protein